MGADAGVSGVGSGYGVVTSNENLRHVTSGVNQSSGARGCPSVVLAGSTVVLVRNTQQTLYEHIFCSTQVSSEWFSSRTVFARAYHANMQAIVRHVNFEQIKCLLLGSPGFVKDDFFEFLNLEAVRREQRVRRTRTQ